MTQPPHPGEPALNHLAHEKSPYLLQHAANPVDWYPWGDEAFAKARREDKPIFLSIGYSTCHWCHVMERESFEDDSVAALLNRDFVSIKVDREERPDVDRIYMTAMQAMGMGGGWPLNVFMTPDRKPFFGGTYFPRSAMHGRPGLLQLLPRVHEAWRDERSSIEATGAQVIAALDAMNQPDRAGPARERLIAMAVDSLQHSADHTLGGFGGAPKFPSVVNLDLLTRWVARDPKHHAPALTLVEGQLDAMAGGGIRDQIGGGFHRYSTDREWLVPHFEKMLYDQAQLAWAYLEGYQLTHRERYALVARGVFDDVTRDLSGKDGGFLSAEDADSEGEEGRFYVWTPAQLGAALSPEDAALVATRYGVTPAGNFEHGASILHEAVPLERAAAAHGITPGAAEPRLAQARATLLEVRSRREHPHLDDKVLTSWNGLMISAFARGARVLGDPQLAARGARAGEFVWAHLVTESPGQPLRLARRWRAGEAAGAGQLDDYAFLAFGYLDLYGATHDPRWLERSVAITEAMVARFYDPAHGGFFESPGSDPSIAVRMKDGFDGAEIAGNSIAAWMLVSLGRLLDRREWLEAAERTFDYYAGRIGGAPLAMPRMLVAMDLARATPRHIVIAGDPQAADTRALIAEVDRRFLPHDVLLVVDGGERQRRLGALAPFVTPLTRHAGAATAYICVGYACQLPLTDPKAFGRQLDERAATITSHREP